MVAVRNISNGARGAYAEGVLVMAEVGQVIEADDFNDEWFEAEKPAKGKAKAAPEAEPEAEAK